MCILCWEALDGTQRSKIDGIHYWFMIHTQCSNSNILFSLQFIFFSFHRASFHRVRYNNYYHYCYCYCYLADGIGTVAITLCECKYVCSKDESKQIVKRLSVLKVLKYTNVHSMIVNVFVGFLFAARSYIFAKHSLDLWVHQTDRHEVITNLIIYLFVHSYYAQQQ